MIIENNLSAFIIDDALLLLGTTLLKGAVTATTTGGQGTSLEFLDKNNIEKNVILGIVTKQIQITDGYDNGLYWNTGMSFYNNNYLKNAMKAWIVAPPYIGFDINTARNQLNQRYRDHLDANWTRIASYRDRGVSAKVVIIAYEKYALSFKVSDMNDFINSYIINYNSVTYATNQAKNTAAQSTTNKKTLAAGVAAAIVVAGLLAVH